MKPQIPTYHSNWHYLTQISKISGRPLEISLNHHLYLVFKNTNSEIIAMDGRCPHMNAKLKEGTITEKGHLKCCFHGWEFDQAGQCQLIPGSHNIPSFARLKKYKTAVLNDHVFIFIGEDKDCYEFPFFANQDVQNFDSSYAGAIFQEAPWWGPVANSLDIPHFRFMHQRFPIAPPKVEFHPPHQLHFSFDYVINDTTVSDLLLRFFYGNKAKLTLDIFSGNIVLANTQFGPFNNRMLIVMQQTDDKCSLGHTFIFRPKTNPIFFLWQKLMLKVQGYFSHRFFQVEGFKLEGTTIDFATLHPNDLYVREFLVWLEDLHGNKMQNENEYFKFAQDPSLIPPLVRYNLYHPLKTDTAHEDKALDPKQSQIFPDKVK